MFDAITQHTHTGEHGREEEMEEQNRIVAHWTMVRLRALDAGKKNAFWHCCLLGIEEHQKKKTNKYQAVQNRCVRARRSSTVAICYIQA